MVQPSWADCAMEMLRDQRSVSWAAAKSLQLAREESEAVDNPRVRCWSSCAQGASTSRRRSTRSRPTGSPPTTSTSDGDANGARFSSRSMRPNSSRQPGFPRAAAQVSTPTRRTRFTPDGS